MKILDGHFHGHIDQICVQPCKAINGEIELRFGDGGKGSRTARLTPGDARILAYALLAEAERASAPPKKKTANLVKFKRALFRLRHAAALSLAGWYLMVPQPDAIRQPPNLNAPLSQWNQAGAFDTAAACDKERESRRKLALGGLEEVQREFDALPDSVKASKQPIGKVAPKVAQDDLEVSTFAMEIQASRCISSDDPRLKSK